MAAPTFPTIEVAFLQSLNGNPYNGSSNPYGMDEGGHIILWSPAMNYMATSTIYVGDAVTFIDGLATQVATDAASAAAGSGTEATAANIRSGTSAQYLSIRRVYDANAPVTLSIAGGSVAVDMSAGINFKLTVTGDCAFAAPTGLIDGKTGYIVLTMDSTGGYAVTFDSAFVFGGDGLNLNTAPGDRTVIAYVVMGGSVLCTATDF